MAVEAPETFTDLPTGAHGVRNSDGDPIQHDDGFFTASSNHYGPVVPGPLPDPAFDDGNVDNWNDSDKATIAHDATQDFVGGAGSLQVTRDVVGTDPNAPSPATGLSFSFQDEMFELAIASSDPFTVYPNVHYKLQGWCRITSGDWRARIAFYDAAGNYIEDSLGDIPEWHTDAAGESWARWRSDITGEFHFAEGIPRRAPPEAVTARVWLIDAGDTVANEAHFDALEVFAMVPLLRNGVVAPTKQGNLSAEDFAWVPTLASHHLGDVRLFDMGASTDIGADQSTFTEVTGLRHKWDGACLIQSGAYRIMLQKGLARGSDYGRYRWAMWHGGAWRITGFGSLSMGLSAAASQDDQTYAIEQVMVVENSAGRVRVEARDGIGNSALFTAQRGLPWCSLDTTRAYAALKQGSAEHHTSRSMRLGFDDDAEPSIAVVRNTEVLIDSIVPGVGSSILTGDTSPHGLYIHFFGKDTPAIVGIGSAFRPSAMLWAQSPTEQYVAWEENSTARVGKDAEEEGTIRRHTLLFMPYPQALRRGRVEIEDDPDSVNSGGTVEADANASGGSSYELPDTVAQAGFEFWLHNDILLGDHYLALRARHASTDGKMAIHHEFWNGSTWVEVDSSVKSLAATFGYHYMQLNLNPQGGDERHRIRIVAEPVGEDVENTSPSIDHPDSNGLNTAVNRCAQSFLGQSVGLEGIDLKGRHDGTTPNSPITLKVYPNCYRAQDEVAGTSTYTDGASSWTNPSNAYDGDEATSASFGSGAGTSNGYIEWDFGSAVELIGLITLAELNGHAGYDLRLQHSDDGGAGGTWVTAATAAGIGEADDDWRRMWTSSPGPHRYWRLRITVTSSGASLVYEAWPMLLGDRDDVFHEPATFDGQTNVDGELLGTLTFPAASFTGSLAFVGRQDFGTPLSLTASGRYWYVLSSNPSVGTYFLAWEDPGTFGDGKGMRIVNATDNQWLDDTGDYGFRLHFGALAAEPVRLDYAALLPRQAGVIWPAWWPLDAFYDALITNESRTTIRRVR